MKCCLKGHWSYQKSNSKFPKKTHFIKLIGKYRSLTFGITDAPWDKTSFSTSFEKKTSVDKDVAVQPPCAYALLKKRYFTPVSGKGAEIEFG